MAEDSPKPESLDQITSMTAGGLLGDAPGNESDKKSTQSSHEEEEERNSRAASKQSEKLTIEEEEENTESERKSIKSKNEDEVGEEEQNDKNPPKKVKKKKIVVKTIKKKKTIKNTRIELIEGEEEEIEEIEEEEYDEQIEEEEEEEEAEDPPESENYQIHEPEEEIYDSRKSSKLHNSFRSSGSSTLRSPRRTSRFSQSSRNPRKDYDISEVTALSAQIYQGQPITTDDPDLIAAAILDLKDMRYRMECEQKFDEALKCEQMIERAREEQLRLMKSIYSNEEVEGVNVKLESTKKLINNLDRSAVNQTNQLEYELNELVQNLKRRQMMEIERHDKIWKSETKMREYNRTSGKVRALRYQQQKMMNSKRYSEADQVRKIADNLSAKEARTAYALMQTEYQQSLDILMKKHQDEMDTLLKANNTRRDNLKRAIAKKRRPLENRMTKLNREEELARKPERVWALRYKTESEKIMYRMGMSVDANVLSPKLRIADYNTMPLPPLETESLKRTMLSRRSTRL